MARKTKAETVPDAADVPEEIVTSIKGFDLNWKCRDYHFFAGQTYTHDGPVLACESGFHAVGGYPLEVFDYYAPGTSRYAEVQQSGSLSRHSGDSKIASAKITIGIELSVSDLVTRAVKWVVDQCKPAETRHSEGDRSAASSTGDRSAASSTGYQSAASSTGDQSAASSTGYQSAAMASGRFGRAMGAEGCALFLVYRDDNWNIVHAWSGIAGRDGVKALTWYRLDESGQPVECSEAAP
jgi:hypothetical protein